MFAHDTHIDGQSKPPFKFEATLWNSTKHDQGMEIENEMKNWGILHSDYAHGCYVVGFF